MQHKNRKEFSLGLERLLEELCGRSALADSRVLLRPRLDRLLDELLLVSEPIVETRATVMIADIRGFTAIAESLPPKTLIGLLSRFFDAMGRVIERYDGFIDKFMGDSVMALFGAPARRPDDLLRALACAVEMQQAMGTLNREAEARGEPRLYAGIAVNTGEVMAGSFGSPLHREYTAIGDTVNLVARMESFSLRGQVLLSESSRAEAGDRIEIGGVNRLTVKGKSRPVILYELHAVKHPRRLVVPRVEVRRSPLVRVDFPVTLNPVIGKRILAEPVVGRALDLGYNGLLVRLPVRLERGAELATNLAPDLGQEPAGDLYSRVVRVADGRSGFETSLQFSVVDTPAYGQVKRYVDGMLWGR